MILLGMMVYYQLTPNKIAMVAVIDDIEPIDSDREVEKLINS
jgi:hypothetical protein